MVGRGLFLLTILSSCVLSLPVTSSQLENEDVKVMKCIVEALADVLSRPYIMPVSQECLVTLKTDDRLVTILRHHNFLKELQEIAVQGGQERVQLQRDADAPTIKTLETTDDVADRSMLEALGGPGERSILSQRKRTGNADGRGDKEESMGDRESQEDDSQVQVKREHDESPGSHSSESVDEWSESEADKREEEEYAEKRANSDEENITKETKGDASDERSDPPTDKSREKKFDEEDEEKDERSELVSRKHKGKVQEQQEEEEEEEEEMKSGSRESLKRWSKRTKALPLKEKADAKEAQQLSSQQEVPHHSKEVTEEEDDKKKRATRRSPEEKELQMIARRTPEERRGLEEEGSASRKSEEPEIESLAAIESELENVAQKLHDLRRG